MKIPHKRLNPMKEHSKRRQNLTIGEEGGKKRTKITFPKEGDQTSNNIQLISFLLKDSTQYLKRCSDVIYPARISLRRLVCGCTVSVPTLDGRYHTRRISKMYSGLACAESSWKKAPCPGNVGTSTIEFEAISPKEGFPDLNRT